MKRTFIKDMRLFLKTTYNYFKNGVSGGCAYLELEDGLYLVTAYDAGGWGDVVAKVAYNCSDLQCDYKDDWSMPRFKRDDLTHFTEVEIKGRTFRKNARYLYAQTKAMIRMKQYGLVHDWNNNESEAE